MDIVFHYPPELMALLIDAIPLLCRAKKDVLLFFRGAGVETDLIRDLENQINVDRTSISKANIARTVLTRLNEKGEATLRERRELLKRVTEFEDFSTCWPDDQLKARGLVAQIRQVVNVKDSFTRMEQEREAERKKRQAEQLARIEQAQKKKALLDDIRRELSLLFGMQDAHRRGKALETVLNKLFETHGILIREFFTIVGISGEGIVQQIDGVIELDGNLYVVEMKWWNKPIGPGEVSQHIVRLFGRDQARGIFISASGYTDAALSTCRDVLSQKVMVLSTIEEMVRLLEREGDLKDMLRSKVQAAIIDKNPYLLILA